MRSYGSAQHADGYAYGVLLRLDANGQLDPDFGVDGVVELSLTADPLGYTGMAAVAAQGTKRLFAANAMTASDTFLHPYLLRSGSGAASVPPQTRGHSQHQNERGAIRSPPTRVR